MPPIFRRLLTSLFNLHLSSTPTSSHTRSFSSLPKRKPYSSRPTPKPKPFTRFPKTRTPLEKQFTNWIQTLQPGFTPHDVNLALQAQLDTDLAHDIFRWTAQQRSYSHNCLTYTTMITMAASSKHHDMALSLIEEVIAGACSGKHNVEMYNTIIEYCCTRNGLFSRAFDVYKIMLKRHKESEDVAAACSGKISGKRNLEKSGDKDCKKKGEMSSDGLLVECDLERYEDCKPNLKTFNILLNLVLRKFSRRNASFVYLHAVHSLHKQMKVLGVIPNVETMNLIVKAHSFCLDMDVAVRVFKEMKLYGIEPNKYSYGYIVMGFCEKGFVEMGVRVFKEMREKDLFPIASCYMIVICSLAMERRFEEAVEVIFDMLENRHYIGNKGPDALTFKTVLEELCRDGRDNEAFDLLEEFRNKDLSMAEGTYNNLLNGMYSACRK